MNRAVKYGAAIVLAHLLVNIAHATVHFKLHISCRAGSKPLERASAFTSYTGRSGRELGYVHQPMV